MRKIFDLPNVVSNAAYHIIQKRNEQIQQEGQTSLVKDKEAESILNSVVSTIYSIDSITWNTPNIIMNQINNNLVNNRIPEEKIQMTKRVELLTDGVVKRREEEEIKRSNRRRDIINDRNEREWITEDTVIEGDDDDFDPKNEDEYYKYLEEREEQDYLYGLKKRKKVNKIKNIYKVKDDQNNQNVKVNDIDDEDDDVNNAGGDIDGDDPRNDEGENIIDDRSDSLGDEVLFTNNIQSDSLVGSNQLIDKNINIDGIQVKQEQNKVKMNWDVSDDSDLFDDVEDELPLINNQQNDNSLSNDIDQIINNRIESSNIIKVNDQKEEIIIIKKDNNQIEVNDQIKKKSDVIEVNDQIKKNNDINPLVIKGKDDIVENDEQEVKVEEVHKSEIVDNQKKELTVEDVYYEVFGNWPIIVNPNNEYYNNCFHSVKNVTEGLICKYVDYGSYNKLKQHLNSSRTITEFSNKCGNFYRSDGVMMSNYEIDIINNFDRNGDIVVLGKVPRLSEFVKRPYYSLNKYKVEGKPVMLVLNKSFYTLPNYVDVLSTFRNIKAILIIDYFINDEDANDRSIKFMHEVLNVIRNKNVKGKNRKMLLSACSVMEIKDAFQKIGQFKFEIKVDKKRILLIAGDCFDTIFIEKYKNSSNNNNEVIVKNNIIKRAESRNNSGYNNVSFNNYSGGKKVNFKINFSIKANYLNPERFSYKCIHTHDVTGLIDTNFDTIPSKRLDYTEKDKGSKSGMLKLACTLRLFLALCSSCCTRKNKPITIIYAGAGFADDTLTIRMIEKVIDSDMVKFILIDPVIVYPSRNDGKVITYKEYLTPELLNKICQDIKSDGRVPCYFTDIRGNKVRDDSITKEEQKLQWSKIIEDENKLELELYKVLQANAVEVAMHKINPLTHVDKYRFVPYNKFIFQAFNNSELRVMSYPKHNVGPKEYNSKLISDKLFNFICHYRYIGKNCYDCREFQLLNNWFAKDFRGSNVLG